MALGIARTADLAGWTAATGTSSLTVSVPVSTTLNGYVGGKYYANWDSVTANTLTGNFLTDNQYYTGTGAFDQTGITNTPKNSVCAATFMLDSGWGNYTSWNSLGRVWELDYDFVNSGTIEAAYGLAFQTSNTVGVYNFSGSFFTNAVASNPIQFTTSQLSPYWGRWLGMISATSTTSSTFAGWTGGTSAYNWYCRTILVDILAGTIIKTADEAALGNPYGAGINLSTTQYYISGGGNTYESRIQEKLQNSPNAETSNATPFKRLSDYFLIGDTFDPKTYWTSLVGESPNPNTAGYQAWAVTVPTDAGTSTTYNTIPAYSTDIVNPGARQPDMRKYIAAPSAYGGPPVFTSFQGY